MKSIDKNDLLSIGQLGRTHGVSGEITARITISDDDFLAIYENHSPLFIFIEIEGLLVPFCIEKLRTKGEDLFLMTFRHVSSKEKAQTLVNASLFIEKKLLPEEFSFTPQHFVGFKLSNEHEVVVGTIIGIDDTTLNILLTIEKQDGTKVLVPIADELIQHIDTEKEIISMKIPEGLLEI